MTHRALDGYTPMHDEIGSEESGSSRVKKVSENASSATKRMFPKTGRVEREGGRPRGFPATINTRPSFAKSRDERHGEHRVELDCENSPSEPTQLPGQDALTCPDLNHEIRGCNPCLANERCGEL